MSNVLEMLAYWKNKTQSPRWRFLRSNEAASKRLSPDRTTLVPDRKRPAPITCGNLKTMCLGKKRWADSRAVSEAGFKKHCWTPFLN